MEDTLFEVNVKDWDTGGNIVIWIELDFPAPLFKLKAHTDGPT